MVHINLSKNKKGKKQYRVIEVSDSNGKVIGGETKLNTKPAAIKNIIAKLKLYKGRWTTVQDNTGKKVKVFGLYVTGEKFAVSKNPQKVK